MPKYEFRVNGRAVSVDSWDPGQPLLYILAGGAMRLLHERHDHGRDRAAARHVPPHA